MLFSKEIVNTPKAAQAVGPYNQAIKASGDTLYVSGQLGLEAKTGKMVGGGVDAQVHQALKNMGEILHAVDADFSNVVKTTVFLTDMKNFNKVNSVYRHYFVTNHPARACFQVSRLPKAVPFEEPDTAVKEDPIRAMQLTKGTLIPAMQRNGMTSKRIVSTGFLTPFQSAIGGRAKLF